MTCYREIGSVQKPYQYVGHEDNAYRKDFDAARVRLCLAFPDAYEIGMSNVGMQILYHVVNEQPDLLADRVYAPLTDMGAMLRASGQTLLARESERPLTAFEVVGFTLQYELCYTNVLYMLDLAGIPRHAAARGDAAPLVMAGGPCVFNPEPVAAFFDFFVVGEGEDVLLEVLDAIGSAKARGLARAATLAELATLAGVYVPSLYAPAYGEDGRFQKLARGPQAPRWVERRIIKDLDKVPYPTRPVTPSILPIHERVSVEIQRGCTRSCRFCQAGYVYRPRRERDPAKVLAIIEASVASTGITDIGLLSLSSADYSHIHPLMQAVMARFRDRHLSVSLPSTRLEALKEEYLDVLKEERRSGFTIAPEAGSQRLRNVINKNFTEDEVVETAHMLFRNGWQSIKMYFMIGQPTETDADVVAIAELANTVIRRTAGLPGRRSVTVSVSNFVPKPHTPFQWHEQISSAEVRRRQQLIRGAIAFRNHIQVRCHAADNSYAEGLLARGDRRVAQLIERAYELGAVFDCWQDRFEVGIWERAAAELQAETGHDLVYEGLRARALSERLPWHRIHSGIHPKFFKNEWQKAVYGLATEDCSFAACHECGLCNAKTGVAPVVHRTPVALPVAPAASAEPPAEAATWRCQHVKTDAGVYVTTLDLQVAFIRAFTKAGIRLVYDQGIRPRPALSMGPALPLGVSSRCELFDLTLMTALTGAELVELVNRFLPPHLWLLTAVRLPANTAGISQLIRATTYQMDLAAVAAAQPGLGAAHERLREIELSKKVLVTRDRKTKEGGQRTSVIDLKESLEALAWDDDSVRFTLYAPGGQSVSPFLMVEALLGAGTKDRSRLVPLHKTGFHSVGDRAGLI